MTEKTATPQPTGLTVHNQSRVLDVAFDDGSTFALPFEYLRVYSPSAEVQGHGKGQETLQLGKRLVGITSLEPVGNYAVQPTFSDGHNSDAKADMTVKQSSGHVHGPSCGHKH